MKALENSFAVDDSLDRADGVMGLIPSALIVTGAIVLGGAIVAGAVIYNYCHKPAQKTEVTARENVQYQGGQR